MLGEELSWAFNFLGGPTLPLGKNLGRLRKQMRKLPRMLGIVSLARIKLREIRRCKPF